MNLDSGKIAFLRTTHYSFQLQRKDDATIGVGVEEGSNTEEVRHASGKLMLTQRTFLPSCAIQKGYAVSAFCDMSYLLWV